MVAMAQAGGGSISSGLLSALSTKMIAVALGPSAVALLQTLQQVRQAALVVATGNGQTALVQGACALEGTARANYLRTAATLFCGGTVIAAAALLFAPGSIARWVGMPSTAKHLLVWLALPVVLSAIFVFLNGLVNASGRIGRVAALQVFSSLAMAVGAWPAIVFVRKGQYVALVGLLTFSAGSGVIAAALLLAPDIRKVAGWFRTTRAVWTAGSLAHFLGISGAMLGSGAVSSAALIFVRSRILKAQGLAVAGQFDAAWAISMNHVAVVLASIQTYYLPAFSAARHRQERAALCFRVLTLAILAGAPLVALLVVLKPMILTALYSSEFRAGAMYLRWTLIGDYLKITSWILSVPMIACADMRIFLASDLAVYGIFAGSAVILGRVMPAAESASVAFLCMYAAHLMIGAAYLRFRHGIVPGGGVILIWLAGLALVLGCSARFWSQGV